MLAKIQNSFENDEEFSPTDFGSTEKAGAPKEGFKEDKPEFFSVSSQVWETIQSDKDFASEIRKVIDLEVDKRVAQAEAKRLAEIEPVIAQKLIEKEKEGFETGLKKAASELESEKAELRKQIQEVTLILQQQIKNIISEKQRLLEEHQRNWLEAISLVMKKFLVKNAGRIEAGLSHWLETQVSNFSSIEKLKVFIPEAEFRKIKNCDMATDLANFEILKDAKLNEGEFRVESKSGGIFFSAQDEMNKLEDLLTDLGCLEGLESD